MSKAMLLLLVSASSLDPSTAAAQGKTSLAEPASGASWQRGFGLPGTDGVVHAFEVFDDGSGPALYVGGDFHIAGGVAADGVARWTGARWEAVAPALDSEDQEIRALAVFEGKLFATGSFRSIGGLAADGIACWDGSQWSAIPGIGDGGTGYALLAHGRELYLGGDFTAVGGVAAKNVARWNGASWSAVGDGLNGVVRALAVYDSGAGPVLYAGRDSPSPGQGGLFRNSGEGWSLVPGQAADIVYDLDVFDDGSGSELVLAGRTSVGAGFVARYDGSLFSTLLVEPATVVSSVTHHDFGAGDELVIGGAFGMIGGTTVNSVARWNGSSWLPLGSGSPGFASLSGGVTIGGIVEVVASARISGASVLYAGGSFTRADDETVRCVARLGGTGWTPLREGAGFSLGIGANGTGWMETLATFDDGNGPRIYAGGRFDLAGSTSVRGIARWDGTAWSKVGSGLGPTGDVSALRVLDDGSGPALYAGGGSWRWDGTTWTALGSSGDTLDFAVFDDGTGLALYGIQYPNLVVRRFDGTSWITIPGSPTLVETLEVHDDGSGSALYAGGLSGLSRWDGSSWSGVGGFAGWVRALLSLDLPSLGGEKLVVGGFFTQAGATPARGIAVWDGSSWAPLGAGLNGEVAALCIFDPGSGPRLVAGGTFGSSGGTAIARLASWSGSAWLPFGTGVTGGPATLGVRALASLEGPDGAELFAGGGFLTAGGRASSNIARWARRPVLSEAPPVSLAVEAAPRREPTLTVVRDPATGSSELLVTRTEPAARGYLVVGWPHRAAPSSAALRVLSSQRVVPFVLEEPLSGGFGARVPVSALDLARYALPYWAQACCVDAREPDRLAWSRVVALRPSE